MHNGPVIEDLVGKTDSHPLDESCRFGCEPQRTHIFRDRLCKDIPNESVYYTLRFP